LTGDRPEIKVRYALYLWGDKFAGLELLSLSFFLFRPKM
jgi:hypothetical protein